MFEVFRRVILLAGLLTAVTLSLWTPGPLIRVSYVSTGADVESLKVSGSAWEKLVREVEAVAFRTSRDEGLRNRLGARQRSLIDSTLQLDPAGYHFYFRASEAPWSELTGRLPENQPVLLKAGDAGEARFLTVMLCAQPRSTDAPMGMLYPGAQTSLPGWVLAGGIIAYMVAPVLRRGSNGAPLDGGLLVSQTLLGLFVAAGFWSMALLRCDPSPRLWHAPGAGNLAAIAGALFGVIILVRGGVRAAKRVSPGDDRVVITGMGSSAEILRGQVLQIVHDPDRRLYEVRLRGCSPLLIPSRHRMARRAVAALGGVSPEEELASSTTPARGVMDWLLRRVAPAMVLALAMGMVVGFYRAGTAFMVGIQGMLAGLAAGTAAAYWARWDRPEDYSARRQVLTAAATTFAFMLGQFVGISLALKSGSGMEWLASILAGRSHEEVFGYRRYQLGFSEYRPGPVGWIFFNLLDLLFLFGFTWLMLGVNLARKRPREVQAGTAMRVGEK